MQDILFGRCEKKMVGKYIQKTYGRTEKKWK